MPENLVIPSQIPWDEIKGKDLEELLYWLFDSMGAKDLEWRKGGKGGGTSDQGRDLECSFYTSSPEGDLSQQKWWVEAKGRASTVEPSDVKESVLNVSGIDDIDVLVIATNSQFSNPTRDWIKKWQEKHKRPLVKLWERSSLERLASKHPLAVIRLYSKALSPQGKLEVARTKLWNYASYTDKPILEELWKNRESLTITHESLFALIASEMANGDIVKRSWAATANNEVLLTGIIYAFMNSFYILFRINEAGSRQAPIRKSFSYLVLMAVDRVGAKVVSTLINNVLDDFHGKKLPPIGRNFILEPIVKTLIAEIRDVCTDDCARIITEPNTLTKSEIHDYWQRLSINETVDEKDDRVLTIEQFTAKCKLGFAVGDKKHCPICFVENPEKKLFSSLKTIEKITKARKKIALGGND